MFLNPLHNIANTHSKTLPQKGLQQKYISGFQNKPQNSFCKEGVVKYVV